MKWVNRFLVSAVTLVCVCFFAYVATGCMSAYRQSVGASTEQAFSKVFLTDYNTAWQAVIDSLKSTRQDVTNREGGFIQTRWMDNTSEKNFVDSFGGQDAYLKAQYRVKVAVMKGFYNGRGSIKVNVQKEQVIQKDVLEGWKPVETDGIDENTLLYRIGRIILIRMKLAQLEEQKAKKAVDQATF